MATIEQDRTQLGKGLAIPAGPLALNSQRQFDERRQRALFRYYLAAGAGGWAVGVHTTQFAIREPKVGLFKPVLELAAEELARSREQGAGTRETRNPKPETEFVAPPSRRARATVSTAATAWPRPAPAPLGIAGICGNTPQATAEAALARELGFDAGLLSLGALPKASNDELLGHCRAVAEIIPLVGFYLQPAAGGRVLPSAFWRRFAEIETVVAIKIAPF